MQADRSFEPAAEARPSLGNPGSRTGTRGRHLRSTSLSAVNRISPHFSADSSELHQILISVPTGLADILMRNENDKSRKRRFLITAVSGGKVRDSSLRVVCVCLSAQCNPFKNIRSKGYRKSLVAHVRIAQSKNCPLGRNRMQSPPTCYSLILD